nr:hypothetical protein CFP56_01416 [Quercus suber]
MELAQRELTIAGDLSKGNLLLGSLRRVSLLALNSSSAGRSAQHTVMSGGSAISTGTRPDLHAIMTKDV